MPVRIGSVGHEDAEFYHELLHLLQEQVHSAHDELGTLNAPEQSADRDRLERIKVLLRLLMPASD